MHPNFYELVQECPSPLMLLTNGSLLTATNLEYLENCANVKELKISYDGAFSPHAPREQAETVLLNLKSLSVKIPYTVSTILTKSNAENVNELYNHVAELTAYRWQLDIPFPMGRAKQHTDVFLSNQQYVDIAEALIARFERDDPGFILQIMGVYNSDTSIGTFPNPMISREQLLRHHPCGYFLGNITIRCDGTINFCPSLSCDEVNFGSVCNSTISDALSSTKYNSFMDLSISDLDECVECEHLQWCAGGCRSNAYSGCGNFLSKDIISCNRFEALQDSGIEYGNIRS